MEQKTYSITELEQITGVDRRTIHFYIQEKVIPPSEGAGGAAHYTEEHLLRLILVKQMQQSHLKLSGIKEALDGLSLDEMRDLSKAAKKRPSHKWNQQAIRNWLVDEAKEKKTKPSGLGPMYSVKENPSDSFKPSKAKNNTPDVRYSVEEDFGPFGKDSSRDSPADKQKSWERFEIAEGVEINVRSDIAHENEADLKAIVEKLRRIMKENA